MPKQMHQLSIVSIWYQQLFLNLLIKCHYSVLTFKLLVTVKNDPQTLRIEDTVL